MDSIPKGYSTLRSAFASAGESLVPGWRGNELDPEIWDTVKVPKSYGGVPQESSAGYAFIVEQFIKHARTQWGKCWLEAIKRFRDQFTSAQFKHMHFELDRETYCLAIDNGDRQKDSDAIAEKKAAYFIVDHAYRDKSEPWYADREREMPSLQTGTGRHPIRIDRKLLETYEKEAHQYLSSRYEESLAAQKRWRELLGWFRDRIFAGTLNLSFVERNGERIQIPSGVLVGANAEERLKDLLKQEPPVLIEDAALERLIDKQSLHSDAIGLKAKGKRGPKPKVDPLKFEAEAHRKLEEEGAVNPQLDANWRQADLERHMANWCDDLIGETQNRKLCRKAISSFEEKRGSLKVTN